MKFRLNARKRALCQDCKANEERNIRGKVGVPKHRNAGQAATFSSDGQPKPVPDPYGMLPKSKDTYINTMKTINDKAHAGNKTESVTVNKKFLKWRPRCRVALRGRVFVAAADAPRRHR